jgi:hypothetical protein
MLGVLGGTGGAQRAHPLRRIPRLEPLWLGGGGLSPERSVLMFVFFSNRLGCFGSLVLSLALTAVLILLLTR